MSILHTTTRIEDVPADGVNVQDITEEYRHHFVFEGPNAEERNNNFHLYLYETHVGLCLEDRERNGYNDSDFDMLVWNDEKNAPEWIEYASTRGWSYPCYGSKTDATEEVVAKWKQYKKELHDAAVIRDQEIKDQMPTKGKNVLVVKGRKLPKGTEARVFWSTAQIKMDKHYGIVHLGYEGRVGLETADGQRIFMDAGNVEVVRTRTA